MMKDKKIGLILGRFNPLHIGHEYLINYALTKCDVLLVFVGSASKQDTLENPFSYKEREMMLKTVFKDKIIVAPLNDLGVGDVPTRGEYLLSSALKIVPRVDIFFYGDEDKCNKWFKKEVGNHVIFEPISRNHIDIHGIDIRNFLLNNDEESFKKYTNSKLHPLYKELRKRLLEIRDKNYLQF